SLARLFEVCTSRPGILLANGIAGNGSQLGDRIALLLKRGRSFSAGISFWRVAVGTVVVMAVAGVTSRAPSWVALAHPQSPRPARSAPVKAEIPVADLAPAPAPPHSFLAGLVAAGYGDLSVDEIVNLKVQGVGGDYLIAMSKVGWGKLPPGKL